MIDVIYLAAGQGKRAKLGYPKQFARIGGKPIMVHALEILQSMREIEQIIVVCPQVIQKDEQKWVVEDTVLQYGVSKAVFVEGGETRQESVRRGLEYVRTDYVLITEAVRPFITVDFVRGIIRLDGDLVTPVSASIASVLEWNSSGTLTSWVRGIPRENVGEVQMPQKYKTGILREAHEKAVLQGRENLVHGASSKKVWKIPFAVFLKNNCCRQGIC